MGIGEAGCVGGIALQLSSCVPALNLVRLHGVGSGRQESRCWGACLRCFFCRKWEVLQARALQILAGSPLVSPCTLPGRCLALMVLVDHAWLGHGLLLQAVAACMHVCGWVSFG
jgi:hypothetical protein